jgi:hypothetical protein
MKSYIYIFIILLLTTSITKNLRAQGCVAVKNMSSCSLNWGEEQGKSWQFSLNYRYFRSYKHFRGKEEEKVRVQQGTEVINHDNSVLFGALYTVNKRFSVSTTIPYVNIDRSSLYEHYGNTPGNPRFHTQSNGLGDIRLTAYYAALNDKKNNLSVGLGIKLPTGNYNYKDHFHKRGSENQDSLIYKVVDQSIQPGDGGTGLILEADYARLLSKHFDIFVTGSYLFNPRNTNGIARSATLTNNIPLSNEFSVADQFLFRLGTRYSINQFKIGLGARYEGIPSEDILGKSDGFRRPGYIISFEPSIGYAKGQHSVIFNLPLALERNRVQNTIDKIRTEQTGTHTIGDAAFADWLLSVTYSYRIMK